MSTVPANPPAGAAPAPGAAPARSRRRPSGEPPPLPRHVPPSAVWYLAGLAVTVALWVALRLPPAASALNRADDAALRLLAPLRTPAATSMARAFDHLGSSLVIRVLASATIVALVAFRRFPHLIAYL